MGGQVTRPWLESRRDAFYDAKIADKLGMELPKFVDVNRNFDRDTDNSKAHDRVKGAKEKKRYRKKCAEEVKKKGSPNAAP